jgi:hypothetical protein
MTGRNAVATLALWVLAVLALESRARAGEPAAVASRSVDVRPRPLDPIPPGTVIGDEAPKGWTDLVLIATPRIGVGDVDEVPRAAASYSSMFLFTVLAKVRSERVNGEASYFLDKVAIGTALNINGRNVIADGENTFGADLGIIGRHVLAENERILKDDFRQVARTATMVVFDAKAFVLRNHKHRPMVLRHAIMVSPATGQVSTFVWLLGSDEGNGYALADKGLQKLPPAFREDRVLSVDGQKFTLGIPSNDAFALAKIPQGTALGFSEALKAVAATRQFTDQATWKLEAELQARYAPVAARVKVASRVRD